MKAQHQASVRNSKLKMKRRECIEKIKRKKTEKIPPDI